MINSLTQLKSVHANLKKLLKLQKDGVIQLSVDVFTCPSRQKEKITLEVGISTDINFLLSALVQAAKDSESFWLKAAQKDLQELETGLTEFRLND